MIKHFSDKSYDNKVKSKYIYEVRIVRLKVYVTWSSDKGYKIDQRGEKGPDNTKPLFK